MKMEEINGMSVDELRRESQALRKALFNLRLQKAIGQLEKPHKLSDTRRDLARVLTVLRQRGAAEEAR